MASRWWPRPALAVAAALAAALTVAGCVSLPSGGPVQSYQVTQGPDAQAQPYVQDDAGPPLPGWLPQQIVEGFLTASASFGDNEQVAREYLTPQASKNWNPTSAIVYKDGPNPSAPVYSMAPAPKPTAKATGTPKGKAAAPPETATVTIGGKVQATLSQSGSYSVASASDTAPILPSFQLVKVGGQWRIENAWDQLLLTAESFQNDYQLRKLYFFDPQTKYLVPDPIYVSLQTTPASLMDFLVDGLITPPLDWLSHGTKSAFPPKTKLIGDVSVDGPTAVVNLGGGITRASQSQSVMQQISSQLYWTLTGSGQGGQAIKSVEVLINGKLYFPVDSQGNPVQTDPDYNPAYGAHGTFYFLGDGGQLYSQAGAQGSPVDLGPIGANGANGTTFDQIAVSPDGKYLAAVDTNGDLYTGPLGGMLGKQSGSGYTSLSWDRSDDLWATTNGQVMVVLPDGRQLTVSGVQNVTALAVAPDGVRVAMIYGDDLLEFGAISRQGQNVEIWTSPFNVQDLTASFETVTWYGPDDVITLANPGLLPSVTEYPVDGGTSQAIPTVPNMQSISTSSGSALIASLSGNHMEYDASLTGSWEPLSTPGITPVYPG